MRYTADCGMRVEQCTRSAHSLAIVAPRRVRCAAHDFMMLEYAIPLDCSPISRHLIVTMQFSMSCKAATRIMHCTGTCAKWGRLCGGNMMASLVLSFHDQAERHRMGSPACSLRPVAAASARRAASAECQALAESPPQQQAPPIKCNSAYASCCLESTADAGM
jgi:hypothetical protein